MMLETGVSGGQSCILNMSAWGCLVQLSIVIALIHIIVSTMVFRQCHRWTKMAGRVSLKYNSHNIRSCSRSVISWLILTAWYFTEIYTITLPLLGLMLVHGEVRRNHPNVKVKYPGDIVTSLLSTKWERRWSSTMISIAKALCNRWMLQGTGSIWWGEKCCYLADYSPEYQNGIVAAYEENIITGVADWIPSRLSESWFYYAEPVYRCSRIKVLFLSMFTILPLCRNRGIVGISAEKKMRYHSWFTGGKWKTNQPYFAFRFSDYIIQGIGMIRIQASAGNYNNIYSDHYDMESITIQNKFDFGFWWRNFDKTRIEKPWNKKTYTITFISSGKRECYFMSIQLWEQKCNF